MCSDERAVDKAGIHRYASVSKDRRLEKDDQIRYVLQVVGWTLLNAGELIFTRITSVPFFTGTEDRLEGMSLMMPVPRCTGMLRHLKWSFAKRNIRPAQS